jgi:hypothetical protein
MTNTYSQIDGGLVRPDAASPATVRHPAAPVTAPKSQPQKSKEKVGYEIKLYLSHRHYKLLEALSEKYNTPIATLARMDLIDALEAKYQIRG